MTPLSEALQITKEIRQAALAGGVIDLLGIRLEKVLHRAEMVMMPIPESYITPEDRE